MDMSTSVILGLGNILLGDDGAGIHTINRLKAKPSFPENVSLIDGGTLSFSLLEVIESAESLIVIDAMEMDTPAGTCRVFVDDQLDEFLAAPVQRNVHDVNLGDLLRMCALRDSLPSHRVLIGIQPETIDWQEEPTSAVSTGIDQVCDNINKMLQEWAHDHE